MAETILRVDALSKNFGGVRAVRDLSFDVAAGEIVGLIGPNGSGKSTTVNVLAGLLTPTSGSIILAGQSIEGLPEPARVTKGLARTFQTARVFPEFTVRQHVSIGCHAVRTVNPFASILPFGSSADDDETAAHVDHLLRLCSLASIADRPVGGISSAQQRFLMIATALAARPRVLLVDEPAAGLVEHERQELAELVRGIRSSGVAVVIIEHHMALIMALCDRIVVLNFGSKIAQGTPAEIRANPAVIDAYLGEAA
ncbi:MAG: ABC transporter ATP-binding protein [Bosea sp. 12-68-7]|jgi:branched-chain amino acid transport system ATP-binding protein|nr:MAG: ABC transporter ATP-binding protein [Bosea sp. 12-68-7]OYX00956.1 MAG: ABC transporter ATP-binding protein [Bosea sp. 32-68-6]